MAKKLEKVDGEVARIHMLPREDLEKAAIGYLELSRRTKKENDELKQAFTLSSKRTEDLFSSIISLAEFVMGSKYTGIHIEFSTRDYYWVLVGLSSEGDKTILSREKSLNGVLSYWVDRAKEKRERHREDIVAIDNILSKLT